MTNTMDKQVRKMSYADKKAKLDSILAETNFLSKAKTEQDGYLRDVARMMVSPSTADDVLMPRPFPIREGTAKYPIIVEVTGSDANAFHDFGIIARPILSGPLLITNQTPGAESSSNKIANWTYDAGNIASAEADLGCQVESSLIADYIAIPLVSAGGATVTFSVTSGDIPFACLADVYYHTGGIWYLLGTTSAVDLSLTGNLVGSSWAIGYTHYRIVLRPNGVGDVKKLSCTLNVKVTTTAGTTGCGDGIVQTRMSTYYPKWDSLLAVADHCIITAMECLVTYLGSTFVDGGGISACDAPQGIPIAGGDFYSSILDRNYDVCEGRLASKGSDPGGAHWHCIPGSQSQLFGTFNGQDLENDSDIRCGYFGVKGLLDGQVVRVKVNLVVQFRTTDPSYKLSHPPPMRDLSMLLSLLVKEIPLVSSNDDHLDKIKKVGKVMARLGKSAYDHREDIAKLAKQVAKLAPLLLV